MNLRFVVIGMVSLVLVSVSAEAQNEPDWAGFQVGVHIGSAWAGVNYVEPDDPAAGIEPNIRGFVGGLIVGYNRQTPRFVFGLEGDVGAGTMTLASGDSEGNDYSEVDPGWHGHLRGRIGWQKRMLPYFTAGVAMGRVTLDDSDTNFGEDSATHFGWTVGGGIDHAVSDRLVVRAEYLYDDYGQQRYTISSPPGPFFPSYEADVSLASHTLRAAVIYRF